LIAVAGGPYLGAAIGNLVGGPIDKLPPLYFPDVSLTVFLITTALIVACLLVGADL
jgi:hypothetical protein